MDLAIKRAIETDADLVLATDPDTDRLGAAVRDNEGNFIPVSYTHLADRKLSARDIQNYMRDHYEDTELDWRYDLGAGPFNSPYRLSPLTYKLDDESYCNERPIATQQTAFSFVAQMRSWLPNEIGGIFWFGIDDAAQTVYYPFYCGHTEVPHEMEKGNGDLLTFSWTSAFWIHNWVSNMVYSRYSDCLLYTSRCV